MSGTDRACTLSERVFARLMLLFPRAFRDRFGGDMRDLFRDQVREARARDGISGVARLWVRTIPSLLQSALLERRDARRERSSVIHRPRTRTHRRDSVLQTLMTDLRYAGRMLRKAPVFTLVAVLVVSLGTGAVTTIFSAMNAVVLRPLPGTTDGERLVGVRRVSADGSEGMSASYAYYRHIRDEARTLDGVASWSKASISIADRGEGHAVYGNIVSGNYFQVLGVRPALGRFFLPDEDRTPLTHPVVVVSHSFWTSVLGADSSVVGRSVTVNGHPYTVIGVAPAGFRGVFTPLKTDAWVPLMMQAQIRPGRDLENAVWLWMFGRLADGVSRDAAHVELVTLTDGFIRDAGERAGNATYRHIDMAELTGLPTDARSDFLEFMALLLGAATLVMLIASVNVASMLSARALARRREMALRTALGAGRGRLVRQLLTESLVLFVLGAFGGVAVAWVATGAFERLSIPGDASVSLDLSPDPRVLGFALLVSLVTGLVFGLTPALRAAGRDISARLRADAAASGTRRSFAGRILIVGQLAMSLVLLVAAGLFMRALERGARMDPGFDTSGVVTAYFNAESWGYDEAKGRAFYAALRERLESAPGVTAVSYSSVVPLAATSANGTIRLGRAEGNDDDASDRVRVQLNNVDAGFFDVLQLPIVSGRALSREDDVRAPSVAVINQTFARRHFPDGDAVGRTFVYQGTQVTIVGIARDAKYASLNEEASPFAYFPWRRSTADADTLRSHG
jgi:predicted permease